jgi:5'-3' exonuclease
MCDNDSPILDLYPKEFELDMNGKKQVWEAVVKIPFINEKRLLQAMARMFSFFLPFSLTADELLSQGASTH